MFDLATVYVMPRDSRKLTAACKYAEIAVREAENAKSAGTFGVGGLLIGNDGKIYKIIRNTVIQGNSVHDPTAHVERQLVDWYFSKKREKKTKNLLLPPANKTTIITSLDPCMMCSGAILAGGFNVIHISQDSQTGTSCRGVGDFSTLPDGLEQRARETFSAFGVVGNRLFNGPPDSIFSGDEIDSKLDRRSVRAFSSSLKKVKGIINNHHGQSPDKLTDPKTLARSSRIFRLLKKYNSKVFSDGYLVDFDKPGINLGQILVEKAKESHEKSGVFNSACLIDPFGNVLLSEAGAEDASPIRAPFLELVRKYHRLLLEAGAEGSKHLAHLKYCKTVTMLGPGRDPKSLMEVGCFGSCIEGKLPKGEQMQYVIPQQGQDDLQNMLNNLPPLYLDVMRLKDAIHQVKDVQLQQFCTSKATLFASGRT